MLVQTLLRTLHGSRNAACEGSSLTRTLFTATSLNTFSQSSLSKQLDANTRVNSQQQASPSSNTTETGVQEWSAAQSSFAQQQFRGIKVLRRQFELPPEIKAIVDQKMEAARQARPAAIAPELAPRSLTAESVRSGCIAYKAGMTQEWDEHGVRVPLTVLWVDDCQVVAVKTEESYGYTALQLGAGHVPARWAKKRLEGYFLKQGVPVKDELFEFKVTPDALMPVGTHIPAAHFVAGQHVDVTGWTKWKGFQGVMKRWNFKGQPASHGVSLSHRAPGSIGNRADPGRVFKGKRMPGHMGDERRTVRHCLVYKVDPARNLVYIRGQVPGPAGQVVLLKDTKMPHERRTPLALPFPTHIPQPGQEVGLTVAKATKDPYKPFSEETDYFEVNWKKSD